MSTTKITTRNIACRCGCQGQDPWHVGFFNRVVRDVVEIEPVVNPTNTPVATIVARGTAKFPWGVEPVVCEQYTFDGKVLKCQAWRLETLKR